MAGPANHIVLRFEQQGRSSRRAEEHAGDDTTMNMNARIKIEMGIRLTYDYEAAGKPYQ